MAENKRLLKTVATFIASKEGYIYEDYANNFDDLCEFDRERLAHWERQANEIINPVRQAVLKEVGEWLKYIWNLEENRTTLMSEGIEALLSGVMPSDKTPDTKA